MYTCDLKRGWKEKKKKERKTGKKLKKCRPYDTVMRIVFHGVSIFELITREKKGREKKRRKEKFRGKREKENHWMDNENPRVLDHCWRDVFNGCTVSK